MNNQQDNCKALSQGRSWRSSSLLSCLEDEVYRPPPSRTQVETNKPPSKFEHGGSFNRRDNYKDSKQKELIWITITTAMKHFSIPKSISFLDLECNFLDRDDMPFQKSIDNLMKGEERRAMNLANSASITIDCNESNESLEAANHQTPSVIESSNVHHKMAQILLNDKDQWQKLRVAMQEEQGLLHMGLHYKMTDLISRIASETRRAQVAETTQIESLNYTSNAEC